MTANQMTAGALVPHFFETHAVRSTVVAGEPWFVAKDVCEALGIKWKRAATLASIPDDWKGGRNLQPPTSGSRGGGGQELTIINERAVYKLAFRSNKPAAERFTNWVAGEVLPAIRKAGSYSVARPSEQTPAERRHRNRLRYWKLQFAQATSVLDDLGVDVEAIDMKVVKAFGRMLTDRRSA